MADLFAGVSSAGTVVPVENLPACPDDECCGECGPPNSMHRGRASAESLIGLQVGLVRPGEVVARSASVAVAVRRDGGARLVGIGTVADVLTKHQRAGWESTRNDGWWTSERLDVWPPPASQSDTDTVLVLSGLEPADQDWVPCPDCEKKVSKGGVMFKTHACYRARVQVGRVPVPSVPLGEMRWAE